jgi:hypothetical protein
MENWRLTGGMLTNNPDELLLKAAVINKDGASITIKQIHLLATIKTTRTLS